jgi:hypothetical protein
MKLARSCLQWLLLAPLFVFGHSSYAATFTGLGVLPEGGQETRG